MVMNLLSVRREVGEFKERYKWMALCVVLALLGIVTRLVYLQIIERDHWVAEAERNILKRVRLPATRGLRSCQEEICLQNCVGASAVA